MSRINARFVKTSKLVWHTYTVVLVLVLMLPKPTRAQTDDTAFGTGALASDTSGFWNSAFGFDALTANTTGTRNTAVGFLALGSNQDGSSNTAIGAKALYSNNASSASNGSNNTATGYGALYSNNIGTGNTAYGFKALLNNTSWNYNTAVGYEALYTSGGCASAPPECYGGGNTATGAFALYSSNSNRANTADGHQALYSNTTGQENTGLGFGALYSNVTGTALTCVGYECATSANDLHNATAIGANAEVSESNALVLGGINGVNGATSNTNVGIGTTAPSNIFTIGKGFGHAIADGWSTYSSRRWKKNIHPLENALSKVEQLRGVSYDLKDSGKHEIGVIAEEVGQVMPEVVSYEKNGKDATGVDYSRLTALLIEATKEQQRELARALRQIKQQQSLLQAQGAAMRSLETQAREDRETLQKVKAQVAAAPPTLVAAK